MITLATSKTADIASAKGILKNKGTLSTENDLTELRFSLSNELQSTLDLDKTLYTFFKKVSSLVNCSGLHYVDEAKQTDLLFGETNTHRAGYNVSSQEDQLGELQFYREAPFAETELAFIEMLIGVLFYPLRNALKYRTALANSYIDTLTGLNNRQALEIASLREIKLSQRHKKALSILVIDVDHFKSINDNYGHLIGDHVLADISKTIQATLRESDQVFRYGGEEFVALLTETNMDNALLTAERIRKAIGDFPATEHKLDISASIGLAALSPKDDFKSLFQRADDALYRAKQNGRNQVQAERMGSEIRKIA